MPLIVGGDWTVREAVEQSILADFNERSPAPPEDGVSSGEASPDWPDCHQVQCAQLHETLDSLLDMLGCKCAKNVYCAGKMVHICEALKAKEAEIEMLRQQNQALKSGRDPMPHMDDVVPHYTHPPL